MSEDRQHEDLESNLRRALRPEAPRTGFSERVVARIRAEQSRKARMRWRIPASLAAAVLLSVGIYGRVHQQREMAKGLEARREVFEALRLTDQKVTLARQTIEDASGS